MNKWMLNGITTADCNRSKLSMWKVQMIGYHEWY
jgi:hypothetical protein